MSYENRSKCVKELNDWYNNKSWPKNLGIKFPDPFVCEIKDRGVLHCYNGILVESIGIDTNYNENFDYSRYNKWILEIITPTLMKYRIFNICFANQEYKYENNSWIRGTNFKIK